MHAASCEKPCSCTAHRSCSRGVAQRSCRLAKLCSPARHPGAVQRIDQGTGQAAGGGLHPFGTRVEERWGRSKGVRGAVGGGAVCLKATTRALIARQGGLWAGACPAALCTVHRPRRAQRNESTQALSGKLKADTGRSMPRTFVTSHTISRTEAPSGPGRCSASCACTSGAMLPGCSAQSMASATVVPCGWLAGMA